MPPPAARVAPHVEFDAVSINRGERVLIRELTFRIFRGSLVAVVGPSGVGKSSLLACMAGMLRPGEGRISYRCQMGCEHSPSDYQSRVGLVFQHLRLIPNASVLTNVLCGMLGRYPWWRTAFGFPGRDRQYASKLLCRLGIDQYAHVDVLHVSGGERQRAAVARALVHAPELVLADEPVSSLDPRLAREVLAMLREETRSQQRTVVCVLHDHALVDAFADFVLTLHPDAPLGWTLEKTNT